MKTRNRLNIPLCKLEDIHYDKSMFLFLYRTGTFYVKPLPVQ